MSSIELEAKLEKIERLSLLAAKNVFSVNDLAVYLDKSPKTIRNMADRIPHYKNEFGHIVFKRSEIEDWLCAVQHTPVLSL